MAFLEFTFRSFWTFFGMMLLIGAFTSLIYKSWATFWNNRTIVKRGYPPTGSKSNDIKEGEDE